MNKTFLLAVAVASGGSAIPAWAVDCWAKSKPGEIVGCLAPNSFNGDLNRASAFYAKWYATYKKPPLPTLDLSTLYYVSAGGTSFTLYSKNKEAIGTLVNGNIQVSLPANMVAAGGGNMVAAGGGNMVAAGGGNLAGTMTQALNQNPPVAPFSGYRLQGVSDLRALKTRSTGR